MAGHHINDARTIALALIIREFMGNDRSEAYHSYEFGREWGSCRRPSEPLSASIRGGVGGAVPPGDQWEIVNKGRVKVRVLLTVGFEQRVCSE